MALEGDYQFKQTGFVCTDQMKSDFDKNGYVMLRGVFDNDEIKQARKVFEESDLIKDYGWGVDDGKGKKAKLVVWSHPGNDVTGMFGRCEKVVDTCEKLLGGEVYYYHGKIVYKDAYTGGSFLWHQDYGYWYYNGCLFPDMMTVFVALDKCTKSNGTLQILPGSHKCGRISHDVVAGQSTANADRVAEIEKKMPRTYVEMQPGDALFFHCNLLHTSAANESPDRRWALLMAYNRRSNNPVIEHHHPFYTPIQKVPNSAIKECTNYSDFTGKDFMDLNNTSESVNAVIDKQMKVKADK